MMAIGQCTLPRTPASFERKCGMIRLRQTARPHSVGRNWPDGTLTGGFRKAPMRDIVQSTTAYEGWMDRRTDISRRLLEKKHVRMAEGVFPFLRATFYRWVEQWPDVCPQLARRDEDVVLAVGDLHVENFGVWRDSRGRHVWGVNDF